MTDTTISTSTDLQFWTRVRTALGAIGQKRDRVPAYGQAAIARSIGMKPKLGARLEEELVNGWNRAAAQKVSMSLLVIEIDRFREYFTAYGKPATDAATLKVMQAIADALPRDGDICLRLGRATFVIVLPDLPALMARSSAKTIADSIRKAGLPHKESHAGSITLSMGLAVGNPRGNYDKKFFEAAAEALKKAQRKGINRIESVDLRPAQDKKRKAA